MIRFLHAIGNFLRDENVTVHGRDVTSEKMYTGRATCSRKVGQVCVDHCSAHDQRPDALLHILIFYQ